MNSCVIAALILWPLLSSEAFQVLPFPGFRRHSPAVVFQDRRSVIFTTLSRYLRATEYNRLVYPYSLRHHHISSGAIRRYASSFDTSGPNRRPGPSAAPREPHPHNNAIVSHQAANTGNNVQADSKFFSKRSFADVGANAASLRALRDMRIDKPSRIQALCFADLYSGKDVIIADQTGSGKTLAYLLPILQRSLELLRNHTVSLVPRQPLLVVLTPTQELAQQVARVSRQLSGFLKFRTACVTSSCDMTEELRKLRLGTEVLVSTPGKLSSLLQRRHVSLEAAHAIVLDEADVLMEDTSFPLTDIGAAASASAQFVFATATLPKPTEQQIRAEFPAAVTYHGPGLHRVPLNTREVLIDCTFSKKYPDKRIVASEFFANKCDELLSSLTATPAMRTLIFCNAIPQCDDVDSFLRKKLQRLERNGVLPILYKHHGGMAVNNRSAALEHLGRPLLNRPVILITTDRASRGLDFGGEPIDHVVLFDFPNNPSEYLRRSGRTARAGRPGTLTVLAVGQQVPAAKAALQAGQSGKKIEPKPRAPSLPASSAGERDDRKGAEADGDGSQDYPDVLELLQTNKL